MADWLGLRIVPSAGLYPLAHKLPARPETRINTGETQFLQRPLNH